MLDMPKGIDPEQEYAAPDEKATACAITITTQVGSNRSIVVQTYLARDEDIGVYHVILDKLNKVVDRQEAKLQVEGLEANLDMHKQKLANMAEDYARIEDKAQAAWEARGKKGAFKLSEAELNQKTQAVALIERTKDEIKRLEDEIAKARGVISDVE